MARYPALTADESAELVAYAKADGRAWKDKLQRHSWWRGEPCRDGTGRQYPLLYGLRNSHGPSWLVGFRLPKGGE